METKGIPAQDSPVNVTNESVGNVRGIGSSLDCPWGAAEASLGARADGLWNRYRKKQFDLLQGQEEKLLFQDKLSNENLSLFSKTSNGSGLSG